MHLHVSTNDMLCVWILRSNKNENSDVIIFSINRDFRNVYQNCEGPNDTECKITDKNKTIVTARIWKKG